MDRLSELGTARGHAQRDMQRAENELARAKVEFAARDFAYQRFVAGCEDCDAFTAASGCICPTASGVKCRCVDYMDTSKCPKHGRG